MRPVGFSPEKDLESPSSTRLEALFPSRDPRAMTRSPSPPHGDLTSLAPHERLPEILVVPRAGESPWTEKAGRLQFMGSR